jgi:hypothetical protein
VSGSLPDAYDDAAMMLSLAVSGDADALAGRFDEVLGAYGECGAYRVAMCLVATMLGDGPLGHHVALDYPDIDRASYDTRWVARFASAYANADRPTGEALFDAAIADGQLPRCIMTLTSSTVATLQQRSAG